MKCTGVNMYIEICTLRNFSWFLYLWSMVYMYFQHSLLPIFEVLTGDGITTVNVMHWFMQPLLSCMWQPRTLNKVQYPADRDVFIHLVAGNVYQEAWMLMWPKLYSQKEHVRLFWMPVYMSHLGLLTSPTLNKCPFKWQCLVTNPGIILSWLLLKLTNSPTFFQRGFF